jgi:diguanylate cyclase (GGDEF)-like protein/PAS domain S-box-containing protein
VVHDPARRLDLAFAALAAIAPGSFVHCLQGSAGSSTPSDALRDRLADQRWMDADGHVLSYVDPSDHLLVHRTWLEACHGPTRVARVNARSVRLLDPGDGLAPGPVGAYEVLLVDLIGTEGIDAVVLALTPADAEIEAVVPDRSPPPRGTPSFRLRLDLEGTVIGGTASVSSLLGHRLDDLLSTPVLPLIHPDDLEAASLVWDDVLAKPDTSQTVRIRLRHADGSWRWFSDTAWNELDDPDQPGIMSEFHDIHGLVEAEQALHASELSFRTLAESLPVGIAVLDPDGGVQFANHRLVTLLLASGLAGPESNAPTPAPEGPDFTIRWTDLVTPEVAAEMIDLVRPREPGDDAPILRQVELAAADGTPVHLLVQSSTVWRAEGRSVIVSVLDISGEVLTSRAHDRLLQSVDEVSDVVMVGQLTGAITYVNRAGRRFFGHRAVGRSLRDHLHPSVQVLTDAIIVPALLEHGHWSGDLEVPDVDGVVHVMSTNVTLVRDVDPSELQVGVTMRDVTERRRHERDMARLARHDPLTDLPNRFALMERLEQWCLGGEPGDHLSVFFIDLDNLKIINDGLGHSAGDRLLAAVAAELERTAGPDLVARFGGDEFVIASEQTSPDDVLGRAQEFLAAVERAAVLGVSNHVSASIGVTVAARSTADPERMIRDADAAMYSAKRAGRSQVALFDAPLRQTVARRFQIEAGLRDAIADDELTLHLQPVRSMATGACTGVEALCRWADVAPSEFIPIAEDSGLILPLGSAVLRKALQEADQLRRSDPSLAEMRIGVNVSARELDLPDFADRALRTIAEGPIPAEHVTLELTETALIDPREEVDQTLRRLKDAGITLALDDFGTGYSSIGHLRRFPLDVLKLDISYTQGMAHDPETRVIVEALLLMADRLGIRVVAEGIEDEAELAVAAELGVAWVQGYLLGRPAPVDELTAADLGPHPLIVGRR